MIHIWIGILDAGYSMLDAGYSMLDAGYSMLEKRAARAAQVIAPRVALLFFYKIDRIFIKSTEYFVYPVTSS